MGSKRARQAILPFFIPMQGCGQHCVYCDQWSISGAAVAPSPQEVQQTVLNYQGRQPVQVAFYGGSFTALPQAQQLAYLEAVAPALAAGVVASLRVSTRPDAVTPERLDLLKTFGVAVVELGVQSLDAEVLRLAGRAYTPEQAETACRWVKEAGLELGIQLMTGLPADTRLKALNSMLGARDLRPVYLRIYPTLVLQDTELADWYTQGRYQPQDIVAAATLVADLAALARYAGITIIRMGLNPSASLEAAVIAGPYHPAFGQLVQSTLKHRQASWLLAQVNGAAVLLYPQRERSLLFGQKNAAWQELAARYPGLSAETADLPPGALAVRLGGGGKLLLTEQDFLCTYVTELEREVRIGLAKTRQDR